MSIGDQEHMWRLAARYSAVGIEMAVGVALPTLGGHWLEHRFGFAPFGLVAGLIIGFGAATRTVLRIVRQVKQDRP